MWMLILLFLSLILAFYFFLTSNYGYWKKRGVPHPPISIFFGNLKESVFIKKSLAQVYTQMYNAYPHLLYVGFYKIRQPAILVRDAELLKSVLISEFHSFHDNDFHIDEKTDPMFGKNPFVLKGDRWKVARNQLIPCFTTKKVKSMFPLIEEVGKKIVAYLNRTPEAWGTEGLETKELAAKFTTDAVATCAFGLDGRAFEDPNSEFREIGRKLLTPSLMLALTHLCIMLVPSLANVLNAKFFPDEVANYFRTLVNKTLKYRKENNIVRGDFLDVMKAFKSKLGDDVFSNEEIAAGAAGFYGDGYETSSITISYALYELAVHLDIQAKLRSEIDNILAKNGGKLSYEDLVENTYLDNVLQETLRKHPPAPIMFKICTKPFKLPSPFGEGKGPDVTIEPGTPVIIPSYAIHYDDQYYPDPEKFDPDRFSEENKESRPKCTFLSFGEGPRMCLGMRFGVTQVKVAIASVIANFEVRLNKKTIVPLEIDPQYFLLKAKGDIWLNYYKRK
ncbi:hypothetical protein ILUMI_08411 [Ignelater luminosus]|uniref:Cytochrome P450 n=1 Tax=Ignelater luminosus TaxID=2038154 RepID=A0A8K0GFF6_IGNLU|nr:hypothetical protein ILUMI_08411 [Ignelater luminosus]